MYEVELKLRADHDTMAQRLDALDAEHRGRVTQEDTYFDAPHRDFAETDEALRVRREARGENGSSVSLTYKGPLIDDGAKTRDEAETEVVDGDALRSILAGLGYEPAATVSKEREQYVYQGCLVVLDSVADLGQFVEIERNRDVSTDDELDTARRAVRKVATDLDLDPESAIRTSYLGLLLEKSDS